MKKTSAKSSNETVTVDALSEMEFSPISIDLRELPDNKVWLSRAETDIVVVRLAAATLVRTKQQLVQGMEELDQDAFINLVESIGDLADRYESLISMLRSAEARLMVAAANFAR